MSAISVGRIVTKIMGREAGKKAVVTQLVDKNFVEITGPFDISGIKRRRVNINHIDPLPNTVDISAGASDDEVSKAINSDADIKKLMSEKL